MFRIVAGMLVGLALLSACGGQAEATHTPIPALVGQKADFDQSLIDQATHMLYVADVALKSVDVFDAGQPKPRLVTSIAVGGNAKGLTIARDLKKVFAGLSGGRLAVIDADPASAHYGSLLTNITFPFKGTVDLVEYDPDQHLVWAASSEDHSLSYVDVIRNRWLGKITLDKGLEQPRYNPADRMVYLDNADANLIYRIDPRQRTVVQEWPIGVPCSPAGMAINPKTSEAMLGCNGKDVARTVVFNLREGRYIRSFTEVASADQVIFDEKAGRFLVAGVGTGHSAIGIYSASPIKFLNLIPTRASTRSVAYDEASKRVYTPVARHGQEGVSSFPLPEPAPEPNPLLIPLAFLLVLVGIGLVIWYFGRKRARARRLAGRPDFS